jgi:hypothetical protein
VAVPISVGEYFYEIRNAGGVVATEEGRVSASEVIATRATADGFNRYDVEAALNGEGTVHRLSLRYSSSLFKRNAHYEAQDDNFRGSVSAVAGRNEVVIKLGRFREVDAAGMVLFRAIIIDHVRRRNQIRWTGRVATIDANTLVAVSLKHNCRRLDEAGLRWSYEPRMGDAEEIELDKAGRIQYRRDNRGVQTTLVSFKLAG